YLSIFRFVFFFLRLSLPLRSTLFPYTTLFRSIKFFLYTLLGSIGLLIVLIGTYLYSKQVTPDHLGTFDLVKLSGLYQKGLFGVVPHGVSITFFVLLMLGFLIKVPAVPFHTWLP